jgi:D-sedoheptulose 7-phosphate isomerase
LLTAYSNDVAADMAFAQQVWGYGRAGDVLLGISTSGRSKNILHALQVARLLDLGTIGLTGEQAGLLGEVCDVTLCVPSSRTPDIQERHVAIYHALCAMLEEQFFSRSKNQQHNRS